MNLIIRWFVKVTGVLPALIFFKPRVKREAQLPKGGVMIVSNHKSLMDFVLWLLVFWSKSLHTLVAEVLYSKTPVLSWLLNRLGCIKVDRDAKKVDFIEKSTRLLRKGKMILIFPEGQLPRGEGLGEFRPSAAYIALESGATILPVYTDGRYGLFKRTNCIIGRPTDIYELANLTGKESREEALKKANDALRDEIMRLSEMAEG